MANADIGSLISSLVDSRVQALLSPHLDALTRLHALLGTVPARRGPGRPPKLDASRPAARRGPGRPRGSKSKRASADVSKFSEGQAVKYRQGRGEFEAKVLKVDAAAGTVTIQRESDGKKVVRPAEKLYGV